jgi:DNA-binding NarL/FixJ family response regulator
MAGRSSSLTNFVLCLPLRVKLTWSEIEGLRHLSAGKRAEDIASALEVSQKTIENQLTNITKELGGRDRFELHRLAARLEKIQRINLIRECPGISER